MPQSLETIHVEKMYLQVRPFQVQVTDFPHADLTTYLCDVGLARIVARPTQFVLVLLVNPELRRALAMRHASYVR